MSNELSLDEIKNFINSECINIQDFLVKNNIELELQNDEIVKLNTQKEFIDKYKNKQRTKNQHYVPQFYLKLFLNSDGRVETLDKDNKRLSKPQSTASICSDTYFYGAQTGEGDLISQILEDLFNHYENNFAEIYDKLVHDIVNYKQIEDSDLYGLCMFVVVSRVRGKYFRDQLNSGITEMMKKTSSLSYQMEKSHIPDSPRVKEISSNKELEEMIISGNYDLTTNNIHHINFINDEKHIEGFANMLFNKKIRIYISDGERNFVTSDCCVAEVVPEIKSPYGVHFMERIHYFVLSPDILIEFINPTNPGKKIKRSRIGKSDVMYYNLIRSMYGKYLYSKSSDDFIEDYYTEAQANYIDKLFDLFPSRFENDKLVADRLVEQARILGITYSSRYDLVQKMMKMF